MVRNSLTNAVNCSERSHQIGRTWSANRVEIVRDPATFVVRGLHTAGTPQRRSGSWGLTGVIGCSESEGLTCVTHAGPRPGNGQELLLLYGAHITDRCRFCLRHDESVVIVLRGGQTLFSVCSCATEVEEGCVRLAWHIVAEEP